MGYATVADADFAGCKGSVTENRVDMPAFHFYNSPKDEMKGNPMESVLSIARALSDENRVRALLALGDQEVCVCQIIELLKLAPSTVSKHMSILKQAKLVTGKKRGRWMYYSLPGKAAPPIVRQALAWVRQGSADDEGVQKDATRMKKILGTDRELICERQRRQNEVKAAVTGPAIGVDHDERHESRDARASWKRQTFGTSSARSMPRSRWGRTSPAVAALHRAAVPGAPSSPSAKRSAYSREQMTAVPEGANLGLGCGNPVALASLRPGETVLDLGSGAGFDCFLAAQAVGDAGRVIGVDMTPEMLGKARENARKGGYGNVEFRLGEIEHLPVADASVDIIISNCVINLSPDKPQVFAEAYRVLRPGGRLTVSDIVLLKPLPPGLANSVAAYVGCLAGASLKEDYLGMLRRAGFADVQVVGESAFDIGDMAHDPMVKAIIEEARLTPDEISEAGRSVVSLKVVATKRT